MALIAPRAYRFGLWKGEETGAENRAESQTPQRAVPYRAYITVYARMCALTSAKGDKTCANPGKGRDEPA